MWPFIVGTALSSSAIVFFGSLLGRFGVGMRTYAVRTTPRHFHLIMLASGISMVGLFILLMFLKGSFSAALPSLAGSCLGILLIVLAGEFLRWRKTNKITYRDKITYRFRSRRAFWQYRRAQAKTYWRYRWVQAKTTVFRASTADYTVLLSRNPETGVPDVERVIAQLKRSSENVTDRQWRKMLTDWIGEWTVDGGKWGVVYFRSEEEAYCDALAQIAALPNVPASWLTVLAPHPDERVRTAIARNPASPDEAKVTAALLGVSTEGLLGLVAVAF